MSSTSGSAPRTPSKRTMSIEQSARTPLTNGAGSEQPNGIVAAASENIEKPGSFVQVPSSLTGNNDNTITKESQSQNGHHLNGQATEDHATSSTTASDLDPSELSPFDWDDFRARFEDDIQRINQEEDELIEQFDKLAQSFTYWSQSASNRDNTRGIKRLRTRERYVSLAEEALEAKQRRYVQVVGAFKQALEMLRGNGI